ncbi:MAG: hypothetical protein IKO51_07940 [Clostridia bacterium]|nr:hypothetical protein [Clostridia bacterium]
MGIKAKSGLVFLVADKLPGIDPEPCEHGVRYRNGQGVEQEHFQLVAGDALKRAPTRSCFEPCEIIAAVIVNGVCRRSEYRGFNRIVEAEIKAV